jgi:hypothetical protein
MNDIILSFDVGIIHLAYCLFTKENSQWKILEWGNIDLTNRDDTKCDCGLKASFIHNNKYYCKVHSKKCEILKPFEELFFEDKTQKCDCTVKDNLCGKKSSFQCDTKYFCTTHAKSTYKTMQTAYKVKPYKNKSIIDSKEAAYLSNKAGSIGYYNVEKSNGVTKIEFFSVCDIIRELDEDGFFVWLKLMSESNEFEDEFGDEFEEEFEVEFEEEFED